MTATTNTTPLERPLRLNPGVTHIRVINTLGDAVALIAKLDTAGQGDANHWMIAAAAIEACDKDPGNALLVGHATDAIADALREEKMLLE